MAAGAVQRELGGVLIALAVAGPALVGAVVGALLTSGHARSNTR
ncbi:hypothetical protein [Streptomyces sp. NPDC101178]